MCLSAAAEVMASVKFDSSLNPCYSGCASRLNKRISRIRIIYVLILVIVDVPLGFIKLNQWHNQSSLNPCYSGCASRLRA